MRQLAPRWMLMAVFACVLTLCAAAAEPTVAEIFCDGMVLQRDRAIPVWGTADDGTAVTVTLAGDSVKAVAKDGVWRLDLPARKASAVPVDMTVSFAGSAPRVVTIPGVLVGEVWLCAGQSNMAGTINKRAPRPLADMPLVRQYGKPRGKGLADTKTWMIAEGETISHFSSTAIYFGEALHQRLEVPVGLILCAVSGTPIEEWVPRTTLDTDPAVQAAIEKTRDRDVRQQLVAFQKELREGRELTAEDDEFLLLQSLTQAGRLYAGHIEPTTPYGIRGVIWYQGEANSKRPQNASLYGSYLAMLISGLRDAYGQPELPFYTVQLPSIGRSKRDDTPLVYEIVRQQQLATVLKTPNTGIAVTIDIDEGLHPHSKHITGGRLAMLALHDVYGLDADTPPSGPLLESVTIAGSDAICTFRHAGSGLQLKDAEAPQYELAGTDGVWHPATARVDGAKLIVTAADVKAPRAVRYAYRSQLSSVSLFGPTGLPASPFVYP